MAETLKFGAGEWATKKGSTLAYNDENGNFKPLPFTFDRSTSATRVNKEGLIEVVSNNEPRIDFLNDSKGALLLEPSRSNLVTYSEDFSNSSWGAFDVTKVPDSIIDPGGNLTGCRVTGLAGSNKVLQQITSVTADPNNQRTYTGSIWVKSPNVTTTILRVGSAAGTSNKVITISQEWKRFEHQYILQPNSTFIRLGIICNNEGDIIDVAFGQLEQGSYATSYIPTQGSIGTRVAETCNQKPPSGIIGQTEGTIYIDFLSVNNFEGSSGNLFEIKEDNNNRINIYFSNGTPRLYGIEDSSGVFNQALSLTTGSVCKLAIKYNSTSTKVFINGSLSHTLNGINNIAFNDYSFLPNNNIDYNEIKIYNTALTDQELISLTS